MITVHLSESEREFVARALEQYSMDMSSKAMREQTQEAIDDANDVERLFNFFEGITGEYE